MKRFQSILTISVVAFLGGAISSQLGATEILRAVNRIAAFRSGPGDLIGGDKPAQPRPRTASTVTPAPADRVVQSDGDSFEGSVEEYAGSPDGEANQGNGYGDVFDSNGHLLWRFAVLGRGNSHWTILRYFSEHKSGPTNLKSAPDRVPG